MARREKEDLVINIADQQDNFYPKAANYKTLSMF